MSTLKLARSLVISSLLLATAPDAFAVSDNGTLTPDYGTGGSCGGDFQSLLGYISWIGAGSYSPTGLTGGQTVTSINDTIFLPLQSCSAYSVVEISGFSSNPGQGWLTSVTCNGVTKTGVGAMHYTYGNGIAGWSWPTLFNFWPGSPVSCTITH